MRVIPFTRRLSARKWDFSTAVSDRGSAREWSVTISPKGTFGALSAPWVIVQIERADGTVEGRWSPNPSPAGWRYSRTVELRPGESLPTLVLYESLLPRRAALVRQRLPAAW
jgi:hypothetical protein